MKLIRENKDASSSVAVDLPISEEPIPAYIIRVSQAIRSEQEAIREYQTLLNLPNMPQNITRAVTEIIEDEKDHMVTLSSILSLLISNEFANYGDIDPETGAEIEPDLTPKTEASKLKRKKRRQKQHTENLTEQITTTQISTDGINNTTTYKVVADVNYDEDSVLRAGSAINDSIDDWNKNNSEVILTLVSFGAGKLTYKAEVLDDVEFDAEIITEILVNDTNELVWL